MGPQTHPNWMEFYRRWAHINDLTYTVNNVWLIFCSGIHPSQYPPLYSHPGLPALERERLGLPPGPQHSLDPNEQMVSSPSRFSHPSLFKASHRIIVSLFRSPLYHLLTTWNSDRLFGYRWPIRCATISHFAISVWIIFSMSIVSHKFLFFPYFSVLNRNCPFLARPLLNNPLLM